ncbi:MAG: GldG family protein [Chloroflexota bacterium]
MTEVSRPSPPVDDPIQDGSAFYRFSAFLGVLAVAVLAGAMVWLNVNGRFDRSVGALLFISAVLGVLYAIPRWEDLTGALGTRSARQGGNATLLSVAFIGLLIVGNWFVNRHSPQWDLTTVRRYTLSDQTKKILRGLERDVKVTAFLPAREDSYVRGTKDLLRRYAQESRRVTLEFVDPELNPGLARQYDLTSTTVAIFQSGDRKEETTGLTEQDFSSALLKLVRTERKKVYFLQGHQERDPDSSQQGGYYQVAESLKRDNYQVEKLSLFTATGVPADAAVLIVAGPKAPLLEPERQAVQQYVDRGGSLFVLGDPQTDLGLREVLDQWQVQLNNDIVIDPVQFYREASVPVPQPVPGHRVSSSLTAMLLPYSRSVTIKQGAGSEFVIAPLLRSTDRAWGETNLAPGAVAQANPGEDTMGPLNFAVAINKAPGAPTFSPNATPTPDRGASATKGRLVVIGSSEFATNAYAGQVAGNRDFFVNSVNWLAEEEDLISIRAVPNEAPPIMLTNQSQALVLYATVIFIPLAVLMTGAAVWWQRR